MWCYTPDPERERQICFVPFSPLLKALDFSLDNDNEPDETNSYTHAFLQKESLPSSFTMCTAYMVDAWSRWAKYPATKIFVLLDDSGKDWLLITFYAAETYTKLLVKIEDSPLMENQSKILFYPLQWTRVCFSKDSNTSKVRLVVDGELLIEQKVKVKNQPENLKLVMGSWTEPTTNWFGDTYENPGQVTNLNIFSSALAVEKIKSQTTPGCGLEGDFLSWEKSLEEEQWTLHSKARWVDLDDGLEGPCRAEAKITVFPMNENHMHTVHCTVTV